MTTLSDHVLVTSPAAASPQPSRAHASDPTRDDRIALRRPADTCAFVDGGWWPRSLDLIAELPALLMAGEAAGYGEVRRVSYALTAWDGHPPRRSTMLNRVIKLGGFHFQNPAEISLVDSSGWKRITLVVVPPDTDPAVARRALTMAGMNGDRHRALEILDLAQHVPSVHSIESGCVDELAAASWDSEGGHVTP
jgi:Family of unknown function (DUF5994)